jgi:hypothetical protein
VANENSNGDGARVGTSGGGAIDRYGIVNVGLEVLALGRTLAETGRLASIARADQLPAELVAIADVADGIADTLTELAAKLREQSTKLLHDR